MTNILVTKNLVMKSISTTFNFRRFFYQVNKFFILSLLVLGINLPLFAQINNSICLVESRQYPGKDPYMWDALYSAKDGKVYTGLITEGESAHFYVYDPVLDKNILLYDIAEFMNERGKGIRTSCKIHNKPVEDNEGNIYFVTLNNGGGPVNIDFNSWEGSQWMKYDPHTGVLEKLGLIEEGCYPLAIDKDKKYLFGVGFTGSFYRFDLTKRVTKNFGTVSNWDIGRSIFCDDEGNVYGSFPTGRIWKYDSKMERVIDLSVRIPYDPTIYPAQLRNAMINRTNDWRGITWDPVDKVAYGITCGSGSLLFKYDPKNGAEGKVTQLAQMCDSKFLGTERKDIPYSTLAFTLDSKNKKVYFVPSSREYNLKRYEETFGTSNPHHLIMYDIKADKRVDLGILQTTDGRKVFGCEGATVGSDGTLYICGEVEVTNPLDATAHIGKIPVALQLIIYKPQ